MKWNRRWFIHGLLALAWLLVLPTVALAHPADVYLQATYLTVKPTVIEVELDLSPGVLVAPQLLPQIDGDGDEQISEAEGQAYVTSVLHEVALQVDDEPLTLTVDKIEMADYLTIQAGYGTIRVFTTAPLAEGMTGTHQLAYQNNYAPVGSTYQVNAFVDKNVTVTLGKMNRSSNQQSAVMEFVIGSSGLSAAAVATAAGSEVATANASADLASSLGFVTNVSGQARELMDYLSLPTLTPWVLLAALALALLLGGLHALTPGHGKTLVAAYLVGSRGTVKHAIWLGAIVTFTHTASVIVIGLLALFASQFVVPGVLLPALTATSGVVVIFLGARLVWQRWVAFRGGPKGDHNHTHHNHSHELEHSHDHGHEHSHAHAFSHDHGDGHVHTHLPPAQGVTLSSLLAMGVSGGLVPCPEALGILVIAIGLNRILLGLGLIVSFSVGLAAVLIAIGILLVRSRWLLERFGGRGSLWGTLLPLASALIVTVLGIGITFSGLVTYLG